MICRYLSSLAPRTAILMSSYGYCCLQTDTSLALEAKLMKRWEFDSIAQAASCMSSWFTGTLAERRTLKDYLNTSIGITSICNHLFVV